MALQTILGSELWEAVCFRRGEFRHQYVGIMAKPVAGSGGEAEAEAVEGRVLALDPQLLHEAQLGVESYEAMLHVSARPRTYQPCTRCLPGGRNSRCPVLRAIYC
jgi:hypothetical protein